MIQMISIRKIRDKLFCPLVSAILQICLLYVCFFQFLEIKAKNNCNCELACKIHEIEGK